MRNSPTLILMYREDDTLIRSFLMDGPRYTSWSWCEDEDGATEADQFCQEMRGEKTKLLRTRKYELVEGAWTRCVFKRLPV